MDKLEIPLTETDIKSFMRPIHLKFVDADPDYRDGYLILYAYVSGATRELKGRLKDGATESSQTIKAF